MPEAGLSVEIAFRSPFPHVIPRGPKALRFQHQLFSPIIGLVPSWGNCHVRHGKSFPRSSLLSLHASSVFAVSAETWDLESCNAARLHIASGGSPGSMRDRSLGSNKHMLRSCPSVSGHRAWSRIWGKAPAIGGLITKLPIGRFVASAEIGFGSIKVLRLPMCCSIGFISPHADPGVGQSLLRDSCETIHSRRVTFRYGAVIPKSTFCMCLIAASPLFLGRLRS